MKKYCLFIILFTFVVWGQQVDKVDVSSPQKTIYTHLHFLQPESYEPQKAAVTIYGYQGKAAEEKAIKIKKILDGRGLLVDIQKIPNKINFTDTINNSVVNKYVLFPTELPQVYVEKIDGKWYYSPETIRKVEMLYNEVFPWYAQKMQQLLPKFGDYKVLGISVWKYVGVFIVLLLCVIFFFVINKVMYFILKKIQNLVVKNSSQHINEIIKKIARPITLLCIVWLVKALIPALQLGLKSNEFIFKGLNIFKTVFWIYIFLKLVDIFIEFYTEVAKKTSNKLDDQLLPILSRFLTIIVIAVGILKMLTYFGFNPVTIVAGASIGGLAVALASQDTVKNLIGTVMIFADKPFHIGDWIEAENIAGTVETVGFRSSRLRAPDTSIYQIPNSKLSEIIINNKGLRAYRRYNTQLGVRYDTPPRLLEAFIKGVRQIIKKHPETRNNMYNVEFVGFGDSALLIMLNVYFINLEWSAEQASKHSLHMAILKFANKIGVGFAFPSTTVMVEQFPNNETFVPKYNITSEEIKKIIEEIDFEDNK